MAPLAGAVERVFVDRDFHVIATGAGRVPHMHRLEASAAEQLHSVVAQCVAETMPFPRPQIHAYDWHVEIGWNRMVYTFHLHGNTVGEPLDTALRALMDRVPSRTARLQGLRPAPARGMIYQR
mgnify:CR=1 FL=1